MRCTSAFHIGPVAPAWHCVDGICWSTCPIQVRTGSMLSVMLPLSKVHIAHKALQCYAVSLSHHWTVCCCFELLATVFAHWLFAGHQSCAMKGTCTFRWPRFAYGSKIGQHCQRCFAAFLAPAPIEVCNQDVVMLHLHPQSGLQACWLQDFTRACC